MFIIDETRFQTKPVKTTLANGTLYVVSGQGVELSVKVYHTDRWTLHYKFLYMKRGRNDDEDFGLGYLSLKEPDGNVFRMEGTIANLGQLELMFPDIANNMHDVGTTLKKLQALEQPHPVNDDPYNIRARQSDHRKKLQAFKQPHPVNDDPYNKRARPSDRSSTPESHLYEVWADADNYNQRRGN